MTKLAKIVEIVKQLFVIATAITAMYQMTVSNDQRAKENFENAAQIFQLTQQVEAQQNVMEAALKCDFQ